MASHLQRSIAWLCLALVLVTGLSPAQGFVLCIEADGCVSVELKELDAACRSCVDHSESDSESLRTPGDGLLDPCACVDVQVPVASGERIHAVRSVQLQSAALLAPAIAMGLAIPAATEFPSRAPPSISPRVAAGLTHLRSIVLLV